MSFPRILEITNDLALLRKKSAPVQLPLSKDDEATLNTLFDYVVASQDLESPYRAGVGLSAVQIGVHKQLVAIHVNDDFSLKLINPRLISSSRQRCYLVSGEGCLSVAEDIIGTSLRSYEVTIKYISYPEMVEKTLTARGYNAIVLQHELDHLNGILYFDRIIAPENMPLNTIALDA